MPRAVKEWIGKTPDTPVPPRVKLRVFARYEGRDYSTGRKIGASDAYQIDHIIAIINGGENRESNLAPMLADKHKEKTRADVAEKSMIAKKRAKHFGIKTPKGRPLAGTKRSGLRKRMSGKVERW